MPHSPPFQLREYALIADGERGALIDPTGAVAWMCAPSFADPAVFAGLIGSGGTYRVQPAGPAVWGGHYEDGTLVWRSRWTLVSGGTVESRDALAYPGDPHCAVLLRHVSAVDGDAVVHIVLELRDDYGRQPGCRWERHGEDWVLVEGGRLQARWAGAAEAGMATDAGGGALSLELKLRAGEARHLVLEVSTTSLGSSRPAWEHWARTERAWAEETPSADGLWAARDVRRSFAVLRGLSRRGGGTVAAVTTSLPERAEAGRNYDYRYCWIRDLCYIGHAGASLPGGEMLLDDACRFVAERLLADGPDSKPAYTLDGAPVPEETRLDVPGYPGGFDVVGNRAGAQFQLDMFGEALLLFAQAASHGRLDGDGATAARVAVDVIEAAWERPDAGIWETSDRMWTHSRLICAAGLKAFAGMPASSPAQGRRAEGLADRLLDVAGRHGLHRSGRWRRAFDDDRVDASLVLAEIRGAVPADDLRSTHTRQAIVEELSEDGFIYRYGHPGRPLADVEGAFLICNLWMSLACSRSGQSTEGAWWFERVRAAAATSGLFSEEFDVEQHQLRGNLPQAFVHGLLIEAAAALGADPSANRTTTDVNP